MSACPPSYANSLCYASLAVSRETVTGGSQWFSSRSAADRRGAVVNGRADAVDGEYVTAARKLDQEFSRLPGGASYPSPAEQRRRQLDGPILLGAALLRHRHRPRGRPAPGRVRARAHAPGRERRRTSGAALEAHGRARPCRGALHFRGPWSAVGQRRWSAVFWRSWVRCLRARRICIGRYDDTSIQVGGPLESIEREHRWHAQELAEAFMERFPEDPIIFATENWRGDTDQVRGFLRRESRG